MQACILEKNGTRLIFHCGLELEKGASKKKKKKKKKKKRMVFNLLIQIMSTTTELIFSEMVLHFTSNIVVFILE